jgi:hypothetical protein
MDVGFASELEILRTLISLAGLVISIMCLYAAVGDWVYLNRAGLNGRRHLVAKANVVSEGIRVIVLLFLFVGSFFACTMPTSGSSARTLWHWFNDISVTTMIVGLSFCSLWEKRTRDILLRMEKENEKRR